MTDYSKSNYRFQLKWGNSIFGFKEVSGLTMDTEVIEHQMVVSKQKMPGMQEFSNITLKQGISKGGDEFYSKLDIDNLNTIEKQNIVIGLLNEEGFLVMKWIIINARPIKLHCIPDLNPDSNEVAIETLEFIHEGVCFEVG